MTGAAFPGSRPRQSSGANRIRQRPEGATRKSFPAPAAHPESRRGARAPPSCVTSVCKTSRGGEPSNQEFGPGRIIYRSYLKSPWEPRALSRSPLPAAGCFRNAARTCSWPECKGKKANGAGDFAVSCPLLAREYGNQKKNSFPPPPPFRLHCICISCSHTGPVEIGGTIQAPPPPHPCKAKRSFWVKEQAGEDLVGVGLAFQKSVASIHMGFCRTKF